MKVRRVSFAFVSAAFLAAFATTCGTASASSPEANTALVRKAFTTLQSGDAKGAVGELSDAIASDMLEPEMLANALLNRALAHQQLQDHQAALADYDAAISLNVMAPQLRSTALYNRGLAQQKLGASTKAIEDFTASLLINPKFSQAFYSRGNALRDSGQLLFALSDYERALRYGYPDKAKVHYGSATTYLALKRPLDAKRELNEALNLNPDFGQARAQLVMLGDENAQLQAAAADPILTGSVGVYAGGTVASKLMLPEAKDVPSELEAAFVKKPEAAKPKTLANLKPKKIDDRLPHQAEEVVNTAEAAPAADEVVAVEQVPQIPAPLSRKLKAPVAKAVVAEVAAPTPAEPSAEAVQAAGWVVQVASAGSEDAAWSTWKKMQTRFKVLKTKEANVVKADLGSKGIFYRVRLGHFEEQNAANKACSQLKAGGVSCYISKVGS
jgi:tetratricopeptide (TPR) repeat protein